MARKPTPPPPKTRIGKQNAGSVPLDPESKSSRRFARRTEGNLTPAAKDRADRFVLEYLRDFNATQSFRRLLVSEGRAEEEVTDNYASNGGYGMTRWPYVQQKIREAMDAAEEKNIVTRNEVLFGLKREAHLQSGKPGSVSAWTGLSKILGMETKKIEANFALRGGIMIVPETQGLESWEARAAAAQQALKEDVRK